MLNIQVSIMDKTDNGTTGATWEHGIDCKGNPSHCTHETRRAAFHKAALLRNECPWTTPSVCTPDDIMRDETAYYFANTEAMERLTRRLTTTAEEIKDAKARASRLHDIKVALPSLIDSEPSTGALLASLRRMAIEDAADKENKARIHNAMGADGITIEWHSGGQSSVRYAKPGASWLYTKNAGRSSPHRKARVTCDVNA